MSRQKFVIKRGDTLPIIGPVEFRNPDGGVPDLTGATVKFVYRRADLTTLGVERTPTVDIKRATAQYVWTSADTPTKGKYLGEFEVTFPDSSRITYPNGNDDATQAEYIDILIADDLNSDGIVAGLTSGQTRVILKGTTAVGNGATVDLSAAFTRQSGERVSWEAWISESSASLSFARPPATGVGIWVWLDRTTNANEAKLRATNLDGSTRTVDWTILGIT